MSKTKTTVSSLDVHYYEDMNFYYEIFGKNKSDFLILESADSRTKHNLRSFMVLDIALKLECRGNVVTLLPQNSNGLHALQHVDTKFQSKLKKHGEVYRYEAPKIDQSLDEDGKLFAESVLTPVHQILKDLHQDEKESFALFIGGLFGFELVEYFENLSPIEKGNHCPDYLLFLSETLLIVDHEKKQSRIIGTVFHQDKNCILEMNQRLQLYKEMCKFDVSRIQQVESGQNKNLEFKASMSDEKFCEVVKQLKSHIEVGDIFQVVPSRKFTVPCEWTYKSYATLKKKNPSPYMFFLKTIDFCLFGASPETSLKYTKSENKLQMCPIAGTKKRAIKDDGSIDFDLDSKIELSLKMDAKENSEHIMLVDMARNELARVCEPGTRTVDELMATHRYSHVMHLVSLLSGKLKSNLHALQALQSSFLMGTLTGAPKLKAIELIRRQEKIARGSYGGALGYFNGNGDMDTCIVIRSAFVSQGVAEVQAGAGVVADSDPQSEAEETFNKARAVLLAIIEAHR